AEAYGFQPTITRAGDRTINVIYHYPKPGESNIIYTGEAHATFTWNEATQSVDMAGEVPPT
ncbi:MAG TPA: LppP/LprE family lipoprotein, partial [Candidatus Corynebacterium intestinavium]|nr:LppP/LprE family lipoprotein [Candidatus Corynebacterium intestinavium]